MRGSRRPRKAAQFTRHHALAQDKTSSKANSTVISSATQAESAFISGALFVLKRRYRAATGALFQPCGGRFQRLPCWGARICGRECSRSTRPHWLEPVCRQSLHAGRFWTILRSTVPLTDRDAREFHPTQLPAGQPPLLGRGFAVQVFQLPIRLVRTELRPDELNKTGILDLVTGLIEPAPS